MTKEQALENLYNAVRTVSATAEVHDVLKQCYEILLKEINKAGEVAPIIEQ